MSKTVTRIILKVLKITGIVTGSLILILFLLPYIFPKFVSQRIRHWARSSVRTELHFSKARLSFFRHFPALTLTLHDVRLKGSAPFKNDPLIEADEIALGVDLRSVFSDLTIDKIFLTNAYINIQTDSSGQANYNVYESKTAKSVSNPADSGSATMKIQKIIIEKSRLVYNDRSLSVLINARDVDYEGNGDLSQAIFDLHTHMGIGSMDLYYNRLAYFLNKKINADLVTKINTNSLALLFEKNDLKINQLPVVFKGRFEFLKDGYDMDFKLNASNANLQDIFSALPPDMLEYVSKAELKGKGDIAAALAGQYVASANTMPTFSLDMAIRDGYISHAGAPAPIKDLSLEFHSRIPGLNPDSLSATVDSVYFNIDKDDFSAKLQLKGLNQPWISTIINTDLDLEKWGRAAGLTNFDLKGRFACHLQAEGKYATRIVTTHTLRTTKTDTVVSSIPSFTWRSSLSNGYFKYASRPEAVKDISFKLNALCADSDYHHTWIDLKDIHASVLSSYIKGYFRLGNAIDFPVDAGLETVFHLADIKKVYPLDSTDLQGDLGVHVSTKGKYLPAKKLFPVTTADLRLDNGRIQTKYYPHPLENIQVAARITNSSGSLRSLNVQLTPVSVRFEGQPFILKAGLQNFEDLTYNISSHGMLDIGKIYQVFALKGYDVRGMVEANLSLRGRQSDAVAARYDRLFNAGTLKVKDLRLASEIFPQPWFIRTGLFRFEQDKMWFDDFAADYGRSKVRLNGWLSNVIGYMTDKRTPLKGNFTLNSDYILLDELMAFAPPAGSPGKTPSAAAPRAAAGAIGSPAASTTASAGTSIQPVPAASAGETGVIIVPSDLSVSFNADVKKVHYNGIDLNDLRGGMTVDSGSVRLDTTRFTLIDAPVEMSALYKSLSPQRAQFDYRIEAKQFDVQRAYKEIRLFHDLASSASKAQGIISLNYRLAGKLDGNMHPVYPSLKGGGVLSVSKVKVKGLKLFSVVSKETNKDVADPDLSKVDIRSSINNNIITIDRTRMKVSIFRLRIEGQTSFDGKLNMHVRVGLPPFGLIGIPVTITGTQDNPKVRAGRGSKKDDLQETEDKEEEDKDAEPASTHQ